MGDLLPHLGAFVDNLLHAYRAADEANQVRLTQAFGGLPHLAMAYEGHPAKDILSVDEDLLPTVRGQEHGLKP